MLAALDRLVTHERVRGYAVLLLVAYGLGALALAASLRDGLDPYGNPPGADFIIFYAASSLALGGDALAAWSAPAILAAERAVIPASRGVFLWCYPPTFLLMVAWLALLPYWAALAAWLAATGGLYLAMTRLIARDPRAPWAALAFPAAFVTVVQGQNGFLSAAILGSGLLWLDRRPWLAGAILGLIAYKPHLGMLLPLVLLGTGRWRSALATALSAAAFVASSVAAFGLESWRAFLEVAPSVARSLETGALPLDKVPSVFAALRWLGGPVGTAYALHAVAAAAVAALTLRAWRRPGALAPKAGLAVTATLIASPYLFDYDLVLLAIPIGIMARDAMARPLPGRSLLGLAAFAPLAFPAVTRGIDLPVMPFVLAGLFWLNLRILADGPARAALPLDAAPA